MKLRSFIALLLAAAMLMGLLSGCGGSLAPLPSPAETGLTAVQPAQSAHKVDALIGAQVGDTQQVTQNQV